MNGKAEGLEDRVIGCMLGMAIGDSWGHITEFMPVNYDLNKPIVTSLSKEGIDSKRGYNSF